MKAASETTLTPLDLCVLIAHDAVSLLSTDAEAMNAALQLRTGLERYAAASELSRDAILLLMWIDREMGRACQSAAAGQDAPYLMGPERLLPVPVAAVQLEAVWMLFQAAVRSPERDRQTLLETARTITGMGRLEDMRLTTKVPAAGFLKVEDLRAELDEVRRVFQPQETVDQITGQPELA